MTPFDVGSARADAFAEGLVAGLLRRHDRVWWLDGAAGRSWTGRSSVVGWLEDDEPSLTLDAARGAVVEHRGAGAATVGDDLFAVLGERAAAVDQVGWAGYACRRDLSASTAGSGPPDACWIPCLHTVCVDHDTGAVATAGVDARRVDSLVAGLGEVQPFIPGPVAADWGPRRYAQAYERVQDALHAGHTYEVNLTYRHVREGPGGVDAAWRAYRRLRRLNPAPYAAFVHHRGTSLLAASPERFARVDGGVVDTRPVKGTVARGVGDADDRARAEALAREPRTRAENLIVCDLLRNDVASVGVPGSVQVPDLLAVETYPTLHQLVSTVRGDLAPGVGAVDVLHALLPGGSMTGAPKRRTMEVIQSVEDSPRGIYAGAFGRVGRTGADLGMVIRSLVHHDARWTAGTGGGVTVLSDPDSEYAETRLKLARLLATLGVA